MGLDIADLRRIDGELAIGLADQLLLGFAVGRGNAVAGPVLVDPGGLDDAVDRVAVRLGIFQPFQHHHADALGDHRAVGRRVERMALAAGAEHVDRRQADQAALIQQRVDSAGQRHRALPVPQAFASQVDRHAGGRTAGVDDHRRPPEIEEVGQPGRHDRLRAAGKGIVLIAAGLRADIDADRATGQRHRVIARVFERLPAFLHHQPLVRGHRLRLMGCNAEEQGIEAIAVLKDPGPVAVALAGLPVGTVGTAIEIGLRQRLHAAAAGQQVVPQLVGVIGAGELPGQADHRDAARGGRVCHGIDPRGRPGRRRQAGAAQRRSRHGAHRRGRSRYRRYRRYRLTSIPGLGGNGMGDGGLGQCPTDLRAMRMEQVVPQPGHRGVFEQDRAVELDAQPIAQMLDKADPEDGVHAIVGKRRARRDARRIGLEGLGQGIDDPSLQSVRKRLG